KEGGCSGCIEDPYNESWRTICDDGWDTKDTDIVYRQLGCGLVISAPVSAHYGEGSGSILLNDVQCKGDESLVVHRHNCGHQENASVICSSTSAGFVSDSG
ncbi:unnamed protein product, partial [Natator depressus]